jgi:hypothetical protein
LPHPQVKPKFGGIVKRIAALFAVIALAGAGAFAAYRHERALTPAAEATSLVSELPSGAPFIYYLDAAAFRSSAFLGNILKTSPNPSPSNDYANFVNETGFDFSKDLDRVAVAVEPVANGDSKVTVIADGRFDQSKIATYAGHHNGTPVGGNGAPAFKFIENGDRKSTTLVTILSPTHIRIESLEPKVAGMPAANAGAMQVAYTPAAKELSRVASSPMFLIAEMSAWQNAADAKLGQYAQIMHNMRWLTLTATPQSDALNIALEAECATPQDSQQIQAFLTTMKTFVPAIISQPSTQQKLGANGLAAANKLIDSIAITSDETRVKLGFSITNDLLNQLSAPQTKSSSASSR